MRERLRVESIEVQTTLTGAELTRKTEVYPALPAERVKISGRQSAEAGELFPDYHAEFNVRIQARVEEHFHVTDLSTGILYQVANVIPNRQRALKTVYLERINE